MCLDWRRSLICDKKEKKYFLIIQFLKGDIRTFTLGETIVLASICSQLASFSLPSKHLLQAEANLLHPLKIHLFELLFRFNCLNHRKHIKISSCSVVKRIEKFSSYNPFYLCCLFSYNFYWFWYIALIISKTNQAL